MKNVLVRSIAFAMVILVCLPLAVSADNSKYEMTRVEFDHKADSYSTGSVFRSGMHLIYDYLGQYSYITKDGKVVKPHTNILGRSYSGGLAPIYHKDKGLGYIDKTGKVVIPMGLNVLKSSDGSVLNIGNFTDEGYALVYNGPNGDGVNPYTAEYWYTIDRTGKKVNVEISTDTIVNLEAWPHGMESDKVTIQGKEVTAYFNEGLSLVTTHDESGFPIDSWVIKKLDYNPPKTENVDPKEQKIPIEPRYEPIPEIPFEEYSNLSTLTFTGWRWFDNGHGIHYKITNNTDQIDNGRYCLVIDGYHAEVHFIEYDNLQPGESIYGIIHTQTSADLIISKEVKTYLAHFDNSIEKQDFKGGIPWKVWAPEESSMEDIDYCVHDGEEGIKWLYDNIGITR